jgi:RES domain-containing protein
VSVSTWRIIKPKHAKAAFTGEGARLYGGRWNSPGVPAIYTADSRALAVLEVLVHLDAPALLDRYELIEVEMDPSLILTLELNEFPRNWRETPPPTRLQEIGDAWFIAGKSVALRVPSALIPRESNILLNPKHPDFEKVRIGKPFGFQYDARLRRK